MKVSRRDFLKYCGMTATVLGLSAHDLLGLKDALANPNGPTVLWLQGAGCTGCSISFLNRISTAAPKTAGDLLVNSINLAYHPNLSSLAGDAVVDVISQAYAKGNYVLIVEGAVPTAFNGAACFAWSYKGVDKTFKDAVTMLASKAAKIVSVGSCAAFGGIPASGGNPTQVVSVAAATGKPVINIPGCPPHPDWIVWAVSQILLNKPVTLDSVGRPTALFSKKIHDTCYRKGTDEVKSFGQATGCLKPLGCKGPETKSTCATTKWHNGVNWCIGAGAPCIGCTEPTFPIATPFYKNV